MALQLNDVGEFVENVLSGWGDQIDAQGANDLAKAKVNAATASLIEQKAVSERLRTETTNKVITIAVIALSASILLTVFGKFILPKILK